MSSIINNTTLSSSSSKSTPITPPQNPYKVIIIGAGVSGLLVYNTLLSHGLQPSSIIILEASSRIGGRVKTVPSPTPHPKPTTFDDGASWVHGVGTPSSPNPLLSYLPNGVTSVCKVFSNNVWMNPRSALLDGRARVYAGGEACSAISLRAGLKQYSKLMYGLTTLIKAGYDSGKGMEMTEIPVREGIETVRRFGKSCEFNVLGNGELGVEGRAVTRVLMTGIEHWMGAGLGELQVGEFGYCYCRDFGEYEVCREGEEGCYGDYEGGHGKVVGGMGRVLDGILGKGGGKRVRCGCRVRGVEYGGEGGEFIEGREQTTDGHMVRPLLLTNTLLAGTKVTTDSGDLYTSSVVVCTVPLGVLKSGSITFSPPLPHRKVKAIDKIGVGTYKKVRMTFESVTWDPGPEVFMCCRMTAPGKVKREKERVLEVRLDEERSDELTTLTL